MYSNEKKNWTHPAVNQHVFLTGAEQLSAVVWIKNDVILKINSTR